MTEAIGTTEISVKYDLPQGWENETKFSFEHLSELVTQIHNSAFSATTKAVNRFATIRNYVIGYYIVEYEQHGSDRAKYGDRLLKRLAEKANRRGINETLLQNCRRFYSLYPQIQSYLMEQKYATASQKSIYATPSHISLPIGATTSHQSLISPMLTFLFPHISYRFLIRKLFRISC